MNKLYSQNIGDYYKKLQVLLDECAKRKDFGLLSTTKFNITLENGNVLKDVLIQHCIFNSILESYYPSDLNMFDNKLYYFGEFSKTSMKKYMSKAYNAIKTYAEEKFKDTSFDISGYLKKCDTFNTINKQYFQDNDDVKLFQFSEMWDELNKYQELTPSFRDIQAIILENISFSYTIYSYLFDKKIVLFFNGLFPFEELCRKDEKCKKILTTSIFNNDDSIFETLRKRNEAGAYVINKIKEFNIEPLATMLQAGSAIREEQLMDIVIGLGIKPFINDASSQLIADKNDGMTRPYGSFVYNKTLHASYLRGLKNKEDYYISIAGALTSYVISKNKIADIADLNKLLTLSSKRGVVNEDRDKDCGTQYFREYRINKPRDLERIEGMYEMIDDKPVKIDHKDFNKYKGTTIQLRTPALCNNTLEGGICRYCLGDMMYDLNNRWFFRDNPMNIATFWVNVIGPIAQQALLSAKHNLVSNPRKPLYWLLNEDGTRDYDLKELSVVYAFEDKVFFDFDGKPIIPDKIELVEPVHMHMPWLSVSHPDTALFSYIIKITIDGNEHILESDTYFYVMKKELDDIEVSLRHLYENVGITRLYYALLGATTFGIGKNPNRKNIQAFLDTLDNISDDYHITFFHVLFLDMIRVRGQIDKIPDFSVPDQEFEVVSLDIAISEGFSLTNTFATGAFNSVSTNPNNYSIENKICVDTDNIIH